MKKRIEDMILDRIFDIRPQLPGWCPEDKLQAVDSETVIWDVPNRITLRTGEGTEAMFDTRAVRLLMAQFKSADWYLSAPDVEHDSSILIGLLKTISRNGETAPRYLILAPKVESKTEKVEK